jgi:hypothetical protein
VFGQEAITREFDGTSDEQQYGKKQPENGKFSAALTAPSIALRSAP